MGERGEQVSVPIQVIKKEPLVKRVLYGAWDSTKKALESQSPEAWGKRIVKVIDTKIVPHLSPERQQWVNDHREGIREAATYAGVGVTTAEIVLAVAAVHKIIDRIRPPKPTATTLVSLDRTPQAIMHAEMAMDPAYAGNVGVTLFPDPEYLKLLQELQVPHEQPSGVARTMFLEEMHKKVSDLFARYTPEQVKQIVETADKVNPGTIWRHPEIVAKIQRMAALKTGEQGGRNTQVLANLLDQVGELRHQKDIAALLQQAKVAKASNDRSTLIRLAHEILDKAYKSEGRRVRPSDFGGTWYELRDIAQYWTKDLNITGLFDLLRTHDTELFQIYYANAPTEPVTRIASKTLSTAYDVYTAKKKAIPSSKPGEGSALTKLVKEIKSKKFNESVIREGQKARAARQKAREEFRKSGGINQARDLLKARQFQRKVF